MQSGQLPNDTRYIAHRLSVTIRPEDYDAATGMLFINGAGGCEEIEQDGSIRLICYFDSLHACRRAEFALMSLYLLSPITVTGVASEDWNAKWRESMSPARLTDSIWVSPGWLPPPAKAGDHWIKIEPKMAFGTGHHETSRLAARALLGAAPADKTVLDIGAGTGLLCFVADHAGAARAVGVEIDPDCRENMAENQALNRPRGALHAIIGTIDSIRTDAAFDIIVMNMIRTHSEPLLDRCRTLLRDDGVLIWSGLLCVESVSSTAAAARRGFARSREDEENEWWCGVFVRSEQGT
jgi:ribosomal protein L11 methyltransferase